ncbi:MAG: FAD-dependent oxidoreductase [Actinobacteria bacterium]|nr:FAD-dependent oxidoreductase [Actinomycetota bacterium]
MSDTILVLGGGIAGITAALEAAEAGAKVYLVEKNPHLGGRVAQLARYFPKLCPPTCGLEINYRRLRDNPNIEVLTTTELTALQGSPGDYKATLARHPRYVNDRCTACGACVDPCPVERPNPFDYGMTTTKTISLGHEMAYPMKYAIDESTCLFDSCAKCVQACPYDAIDLHMQQEILELTVGAVVIATGWKPYDAGTIANLAFGHFPDVVTNVMFERMLASNGPSGGIVIRPSDGKAVESVAFIQCAGSRDRLYLSYCSSICCLASLKEASLLLERNPQASAYIFYIDLRTPGTYQSFASKVLDHPRISAIKGKVADILLEPGSGQLVVVADDMVSGAMSHTSVDLVVLATGMEPSLAEGRPQGEMDFDPYGFVLQGSDPSGVFAAGCARAPVDVATATLDGTAAAMSAIRASRQMVVVP